MAGEASGVVQDRAMAIDRRVERLYERYDEDGRLWGSPLGELVRLRTWDLFARLLPPTGRVIDVGGGPGAHAAHLAGRGYDVHLIDPIERHLARARQRAADGPTFEVAAGDALALDLPDSSADVVLLLGPPYHLTDPGDRAAALAEARRVLRPGGLVVAEVITRFINLLESSLSTTALARPQVFAHHDREAATGLSQDPVDTPDGAFWAYLHRPDELAAELEAAGFEEVGLAGVEGHAWLLGPVLAEHLEQPEPLLRALRLLESEPSLLGASAHVIGSARTPPAPGPNPSSTLRS
jgi:SAM-dependent methyltransferase